MKWNADSECPTLAQFLCNHGWQNAEMVLKLFYVRLCHKRLACSFMLTLDNFYMRSIISRRTNVSNISYTLLVIIELLCFAFFVVTGDYRTLTFPGCTECASLAVLDAVISVLWWHLLRTVLSVFTAFLSLQFFSTHSQSKSVCRFRNLK